MRRAYTLVEVLVVTTILGIAGAMIIPSMGQTGVLRVQAAVRTIVSDITYAQSDGLAYQEQRAVWFDVDSNSYRLLRVTDDSLDYDNDVLFQPGGPNGRYIVDLDDENFGGAFISEVAIGDDPIIVFDELGGPVTAPGSNTPGEGGRIRVEGTVNAFDVVIDGYTGRITVQRVEEDDDDDGEGG